MKPRRAAITALGTHVPERVMTNADLEKLVDTSDEWIRTRTGISERRIARADSNDAEPSPGLPANVERSAIRASSTRPATGS